MVPSFLRKRRTLQPVWRYTAEGALWRLVVPSSDRVLGESRNLQNKSVAYFCVDTSRGTTLWQGATFGEQWWMGIEAVHDATLFLHKYATPSMPEHKGIVAVDIESGKQLWTKEELKFEFAERGCVYASGNTIRGIRYVQVDARTGAIANEVSSEEMVILHRTLGSEFKEIEDLVLPTPIFDVAADLSGQAVAMREFCDVNALTGPVEFIERNNLLIFNYYERTSLSSEEHLKTKNILKVLDRENGTIVFDATVNSNSSSAVPDTFFVLRDLLMYIHESTTLTAVDLANHA